MTSNYHNIVDVVVIIIVVVFISLHYKFVPRGIEGQQKIILEKMSRDKSK